MIDETRHCLRNLTNFEGRDFRKTFWFYMLALFLAEQTLLAIFMALIWPRFLGNHLQMMSGDIPEEQIPEVFSSLSNAMAPLFYTMAAVALVSMALFLASFVRRLHDAGYTGWFALIPAAGVLALTAYVFIFFGIFESAAQIPVDDQEAARAAVPGFLGGMAALMLLFVVVFVGQIATLIFGLIPSDDGPNRYGKSPTAF